MVQETQVHRDWLKDNTCAKFECKMMDKIIGLAYSEGPADL